MYNKRYIFYDLVLPLEWILRNGKTSELKVEFKDYAEQVRQLDRISFFGFDALDSTKFPVLNIIYSTRPKSCNK